MFIDFIYYTMHKYITYFNFFFLFSINTILKGTQLVYVISAKYIFIFLITYELIIKINNLLEITSM